MTTGAEVECSADEAQDLVNSLQVLQLVGPELHPTLLDQVIDLTFALS